MGCAVSEQEVFNWFAQYAYEPAIVYGTVVFMMVISSFGFPVPEEVTLISVGIVCYMGRNPELFPPPEAGAEAVNTYTAAGVTFLAVVASDFLVYTLGKTLGAKIMRWRVMRRQRKQLDKVSSWMKKYGVFAAALFRFTPGLRFPGHFSCGMMGLPPFKFLAVDSLAALVSVPTQIFLISYYGKEILENFKTIKIIVGIALVIGGIVYFIRSRRANSNGPSSAQQA